MINFSAGCNFINRDVLPAILAKYQVASESLLPSPIKGEVIFLKNFMRYLITIQAKIKNKNDIIYSLFGAIRLFSITFHQELACLNTVFFANAQNKINIHLESAMMRCFIVTMINWSNKHSCTVPLLKNADRNFHGLEIIIRAVKHFNELQRLELLHASGKPKLKEVYSHDVKNGSNDLCLNDELLACFTLPFGIDRSEKTLLRNIKFFLRQIDFIKFNTTNNTIDFLKLSATALIKLKWPFVLKYWILKGLLDIGFNDKTYVSVYESWQAGFAIYIFCKYQIFNHGIPEKGLSIMPLFGLTERDIWFHWQNILDNLEKTSIATVKENISTQLNFKNRFYANNNSTAAKIEDKDRATITVN